MSRPRKGPLAGLQKVGVSAFVTSPLGGMTLTQLGAELSRTNLAPYRSSIDVPRFSSVLRSKLDLFLRRCGETIRRTFDRVAWSFLIQNARAEKAATSRRREWEAAARTANGGCRATSRGFSKPRARESLQRAAIALKWAT